MRSALKVTAGDLALRGSRATKGREGIQLRMAPRGRLVTLARLAHPDQLASPEGKATRVTRESVGVLEKGLQKATKVTQVPRVLGVSLASLA